MRLDIETLLAGAELLPPASDVLGVGAHPHDRRASLVQRAADLLGAKLSGLLLQRHLPREDAHGAVDDAEVLDGVRRPRVCRVVDVEGAAAATAYLRSLLHAKLFIVTS